MPWISFCRLSCDPFTRYIWINVFPDISSALNETGSLKLLGRFMFENLDIYYKKIIIIYVYFFTRRVNILDWAISIWTTYWKTKCLDYDEVCRNNSLACSPTQESHLRNKLVKEIKANRYWNLNEFWNWKITVCSNRHIVWLNIKREALHSCKKL